MEGKEGDGVGKRLNLIDCEALNQECLETVKRTCPEALGYMDQPGTQERGWA